MQLPKNFEQHVHFLKHASSRARQQIAGGTYQLPNRLGEQLEKLYHEALDNQRLVTKAGKDFTEANIQYQCALTALSTTHTAFTYEVGRRFPQAPISPYPLNLVKEGEDHILIENAVNRTIEFFTTHCEEPYVHLKQISELKSKIREFQDKARIRKCAQSSARRYHEHKMEIIKRSQQLAYRTYYIIQSCMVEDQDDQWLRLEFVRFGLPCPPQQLHTLKALDKKLQEDLAQAKAQEEKAAQKEVNKEAA